MDSTWIPRVRVSLVAALVLAAGCLSGDATAPPGNATVTTGSDGAATDSPSATDAPPGGEKHPGMDATLYGLSTANNTTAYAMAHGVTVENDSVAVLVTLRPNRTVPPAFAGRVVATDGETAQLWVPVDELTALSTHRNVSYVRRPPAANTGVATA